MSDASNGGDNDLDRLRQEMVRRLSWRRKLIHHHRGALLNTDDLQVLLFERAEARRRVHICNFMSAHGVTNSARAHRAAIKRLWAQVEHRFGAAPDPIELVGWRNMLRGASATIPAPGRRSGAR